MRIAVYAFDGVTMFHLAVPQMVFDEVTRQGLAPWTTVLFSDQPGSIHTTEGYQLGGIHGPGAADAADVVVVPSWFEDGRLPSTALRSVLQNAHERNTAVTAIFPSSEYRLPHRKYSEMQLRLQTCGSTVGRFGSPPQPFRVPVSNPL